MKVIVIGAGIGGMSAAIGLERAGYQTEAYEAVRDMKPVGAAISLWPNGVKCLNSLGLGDEVHALGGDVEYTAYYEGKNGDQMCRFSMEPLVKRIGDRSLPVARAELQSMLIDAYGRERVNFGKRLSSVEEKDGVVTAHFTDATEAKGDMLVAADGAHSVVRPYVLGHTVQREYVGYVNWNGLIAADDKISPSNQFTLHVGDGKRVATMPVSNNRFYFFCDVPLPTGLKEDRTTVKADLKRYFDGWAEPVQHLIEAINPETTNRIEMADLEPIDKFAKGRVVLLGDAAHSTAPDIGQGGCAALEDSVVLVQMLTTNRLGIEDALLRYQERRVPRTRHLVLQARKRCHEMHNKDPEATQKWYEELKTETGERVINAVALNIEGGPFG